MEEQLYLRRSKTADEYRIIKQINKGSYGDVFLAERMCDRRQVCLKQVDLDFLSPHERLGCLAEVRLLQSLPRHPNVVTCYDAFWEDTRFCGGMSRIVIVLEYGDAGDLEQYIQSEYSQARALSSETALTTFAQIASGLAFLHHQHILHRDIKSKNVFRFADGRVVIGDFGTCKSLASTMAMASTLVGSPLYMSPEVLDDLPYSFSSDIWALGCLLYELVAGKTPFTASSYPAVVFKITKGSYDALPSSVAAEIQALVAEMLNLDPSQRPTVDELLSRDIIKAHAQPDIQATEAEKIWGIDAGITEPAVEASGTQPDDDESDSVLSEAQPMLKPMLCPPPAPMVALPTKRTIQASEANTLSPPPPPQMAARVTLPASRGVFPTNRARIANLLSRERLHLHKEQHEERTTRAGSKFLSCVPVLDMSVSQTPHSRARVPSKKTAPTAKPLQSLPPENMAIVGSKVQIVRHGTQSTPSKR